MVYIYNYNSAREFVIYDINTIANIYRNTQVSPISTCILHVRVIKKNETQRVNFSCIFFQFNFLKINMIAIQVDIGLRKPLLSSS